MQLRYATGLTGEEYANTQAWREATLDRCPNHPDGGCSFASHGTYERKTPKGTRIRRWYCPQTPVTFSLLPDCLAARLPGTLAEVEEMVVAVETAGSVNGAVRTLFPQALDLSAPWRRIALRVRQVRLCLGIVRGLLGLTIDPSVPAFRDALGTRCVLVYLRGRCAPHLQTLPPPLGFRPPERADGSARGPPTPGCRSHPA